MQIDAIEIKNHTKSPITLITTQSDKVVSSEQKKTYTIEAKDTLVIFTDQVETLSWVKTK
jgi:hypothetical protein